MADPLEIPTDLLESPPAEQPQPQEAVAPPRFYPGELVSAISAVGLLVCMFALKWYGLNGKPGHGAFGAGLASSENAWDALTLVRWAMLLTIMVSVGSLVVHLRQYGHGVKTNTGGVITFLGVATSALLVLRVLIDLPSPQRVVDQKIGALIGLLCALGIAFGGYEEMRAERAQDRLAARRSGTPRARLASRRAVR